MDYYSLNKRHFSSSLKNEYLQGNIYFYEGVGISEIWRTMDTRIKIKQLAKSTNRIHILTNSLNIIWYSESDSVISDDSDSDDIPLSNDSVNEFFYIIVSTKPACVVFDTFRIYDTYADAETDMHILEKGGISFMLLELTSGRGANEPVHGNGEKWLNVYLLDCEPQDKYDEFMDIMKNTKILKRLHNTMANL